MTIAVYETAYFLRIPNAYRQLSRSCPEQLSAVEICIIGAPALGIALAREFASSQFQVAVIDSGGQFDANTQQLYEAQIVAKHFPDVATTRVRFLWGRRRFPGWLLPSVREIDFEARDDFPHHGWPFPRSHLEPWYTRKRSANWAHMNTTLRAGMRQGASASLFAGTIFQRKIIQENPLRFGAYCNI